MLRLPEFRGHGWNWFSCGVLGLLFVACSGPKREFKTTSEGGAPGSASGGSSDAGAGSPTSSEGGGNQTMGGEAGALNEPAVKSDGLACAADSECESRHCRDEVCCASDCSGTCQACAESRTGQPDGTCASVVSGLDPREDCETESPESCGEDCPGSFTCASSSACRTTCSADSHCVSGYFCGGGSCQPLKDKGIQCTTGAECSSKSCRDGVCCESACSLSCQACSAATTGLAEGTCGARKSSMTKPCQAGSATSCVDVTTEVNHCGGCGNVCAGSSLPGTTPACSASTCSVSCPVGTLGDGVNVCVPVTTVAAGPTFACGLLADGHVKCWGNQNLGLSPAGLANVLFTSITAGSDFMCGIRDNGLAYCWGANPPAVKAGTFLALAAGDSHVCGLKSNRTLDCWTRGSGDGTDSPPSGAYKWIASGTDYSCAIVQGGNSNNRGTCWGAGTMILDNFPSTSNAQTYQQMHGAGFGGWGVGSDGGIVNWGKILFSPPSGTLVKTLGAGSTQNRCGILMDNTLTCWGTPGSEATIPPSGKFTALAMGGGFACGVKSGGQMSCWGSNDQGQAPTTVSGTFQGYW